MVLQTVYEACSPYPGWGYSSFSNLYNTSKNMKSAPVVTTEKINQNLKDTISQMIPGVQKVEMLKCVFFFF